MKIEEIKEREEFQSKRGPAYDLIDQFPKGPAVIYFSLILVYNGG